ncbi:glycosyltransferase family 4 protein [Agriterribacter sp.]|uniref:glycosyltransferase family 4 protein n=1 Tax=Agriterribacter sp. TaxID=2821509 RepID=UPI002CADCD1E|nr:glycosyltransferase family 4 protein [Agriterribacter sp.]HRP54747.1 glycosyltransferase family 4 protein [Agriterribacter sp.]
MRTKKILIIYNKVWSYRLKIFDILNQHYDLTVAYSDKSFVGKKFDFKTIYTPGYDIGPLFFHKTNLKKLARDYDVVIAISNVRWISLMLLSVKRRKFKFILWGIGVSASYENKLDSKTTWDRVRFFFAKKADAILFYSSYPVKKYIENGIAREKLFVANNTVAIDEHFNLAETENSKTDFLFIGTLYPQKGIDILLNAYIELTKTIALPTLQIIGAGPMESTLKELIEVNKLQDKVILHGAIYDQKTLVTFFSKSLVCISPTQAGLSVLMSMGYGVPFLTSADAITGGEVFNIKKDENGFIYNGTDEDLKKTIVWIINNREKVLAMGRNAKLHYDQFRKPADMANAIRDAIEYVLNK